MMLPSVACVALALSAVACGAADESGTSAADDAYDHTADSGDGVNAARSDTSALRSQRRTRARATTTQPVQPAQPAQPAQATPTAPPTPPPSDPNAVIDVDPRVDISMAASRAPDGTAIPLPAGPNGECPEVVTFLGFWTCVTLGETCTFAQQGVTRTCECIPVGSDRTWSCQ